MKRFPTMTIAAAAVLLAVAPPASASGSGKDGPVRVRVTGEKLRVERVEAFLEGHEDGARARVSLWKKRSGTRLYVWDRDVTRWKSTAARSAGGVKYEQASWKLNRSFPDGSRLCVSFAGHSDRLACAVIHK